MSNSTDQQSTFEINPYQLRQSRVFASLASGKTDVLALNPGPSLTYLTGLHFHLSERPVVALFVPHQPVILALPELEAGKTTELPFSIQTFPYREDPAGWPAVFHQAALAARMDGKKVGVEPGRMRFLELQLLEYAAPQASFVSAEEQIASLRMSKDEDEIMAMRKAVDIAQTALQAALPQIKIGMTERQFAAELTLQLLRAGSDPELPFSPIVSAGPNGANPHAVPTERPFQSGDLLVIDWGACFQGYISDITRTFAIGEVEDEYKEIAQIVLDSNTAGREAAKPGVAMGDVDAAARAVIDNAGYGEYFFHRTGHGIGMEGHEAPFVRAGNPMLMQSGMTFTVEPGIYLKGRNGVRIEDDMLVTLEAAESLTTLPRELRVIA